METAKCTLDNKIYTDWQFSKLTKDEIAEKRKMLICPECRKDAMFQKAGRNGRRACFRAYHASNCTLSSISNEDAEKVSLIEEKVNGLINEGKEIDITLKGVSTAIKNDGNIDIKKRRNSTNLSKRHVLNPSGNHISKLGLKSLLDYLIYSAEFSKSNTKINFGDKTWTAATFFKLFQEINKNHVNKTLGYWGIIKDVSEDMTWLNSSGKKGVSILLNEKMKKEVQKKYKVRDSEDLVGIYVLAIEKLIESNNTDKLYIKPQNFSFMVMKKFV